MDTEPPRGLAATPGRVMLRRELLSSGLTERGITSLARSGVIVRVRHGAYVDADVWAGSDDVARHRLRTSAVVRQGQTDLVVSHLSALVEWQVPMWDTSLEHVDVTRPDQRCGRRGGGVRQHRGVLRPEDVVESDGLRITSPTRTVLDAMTVLDAEHSLAAVNDLLHRGLTTPESLAECRRFMERWPRTLHHDLVLRLSSAECESVGESRFFYFCWREGLPAPTPQVAVVDHRGLVVARVDFAWPRFRVFVEFDGRVKYERHLRPGESVSDAVIREKQREDLVRELTGWTCIRVTWADLQRPQPLAERLRRALGTQRRAG